MVQTHSEEWIWTDNMKPHVNRAIMDFIMLSFEKYNLTTLNENKTEIITMFKQLTTTDNDFINTITAGTSDKNQMETRIRIWLDNIANICQEA